MSLKLLTINLLYADASHSADSNNAGTWEQRHSLVQEVVNKYQPDIIAMQEVQDSQLHDLCESLDDYEPIPGPVNGVDRMPVWTRYGAPPLLAATVISWWQRKTGRAGLWCHTACATSSVLAAALVILTTILQQKKGRALKTGGHCPIFVRRDRFAVVESGTSWVSDQPRKPNSILFGTWLPRIIHWAKVEDLDGSGRRVTIFNTHLDWWFLAHRRSGQILANRMNSCYDGSLQIVMGDFNAGQDSALYQQVTQKAAENAAPLHDAWNEAVERIGPDDTYHGGSGKGGFPGRVDHILFRPEAPVPRAITIEDHEGNIYVSDHFPLVADIEF